MTVAACIFGVGNFSARLGFDELLSDTLVQDIAVGETIQLGQKGSWRASENEVEELFTVVSFVAQVRTADGKVWRYDERAVTEQLQKIKLKLGSGGLEPEKIKK